MRVDLRPPVAPPYFLFCWSAESRWDEGLGLAYYINLRPGEFNSWSCWLLADLKAGSGDFIIEYISGDSLPDILYNEFLSDVYFLISTMDGA